ncbi:MAG: hypothetical protein HN719_08880 [Alphaproteobacteria bacterium]|nr:hypothetical protein [Alphaproteobacteria bacterium]
MADNPNLFNQGGLFGPAGGGFGGLLDPRAQAMLGAAQVLSQAGGPSRMPISTGAALSSAMAQGVNSYRQAQAAGMQQQMNQMKFDQAKRAQGAAQTQKLARERYLTALRNGGKDMAGNPVNMNALAAAAAPDAYIGASIKQRFEKPAKPMYKERDYPLKGGMVQKQISQDGGITWTNLGPAAPASASTNVSVSMGRAAGEGLLKNWQGIVDNGMQAQTNLGTVNQMQTLLEGGIQTGFAQPMMLDIQRAYQRFDPNYKVSEVAGGEAFTGLSNKIILPLVKQLGVNPTDKDLDFIVKGSPELAKSPAGNRLMLKALEVSQKRQIRMSQLSTQFMQENAPAIESGAMSPLIAQIKFNQYLQSATANDPFFKQAADDMRSAYAAVVGGSLTKSSAADAAKAGGFVN